MTKSIALTMIRDLKCLMNQQRLNSQLQKQDSLQTV